MRLSPAASPLLRVKCAGGECHHHRNRANLGGMGVLAMKVIGSFVFGYHAANLVPSFGKEKIRKLRQAALRWALQDDRITTLLIGMSKPAEIDENIKTLKADAAVTPEDR